jgi:hypothetical protein
MKNRTLGAEFIHADGQTDRQRDRQTESHNEAHALFTQYCERTYKLFLQLHHAPHIE